MFIVYIGEQFVGSFWADSEQEAISLAKQYRKSQGLRVHKNSDYHATRYEER